MLLLSPLVLVPLGLRLDAQRAETALLFPCWRVAVRLQLPSALLLAAAFASPQGLLAASLGLPWLATTTLLGLVALARLWQRGLTAVSELSMDAAWIFLPVGAGWAALSRWGARPLDFEPIIVLLTAAHFHHAGFVLPLVTGLAGRAAGGKTAWVAAVGVVGGVPLVAAGITATQLGCAPILEVVAAMLTTLAALLTAWLHFQLAGERRWPGLARGSWLLASLVLVGGMSLAGLYGCRSLVPLAWLDIPWMRAWHGSGNALGFGLPVMFAWALASGRERC